MCGRVAGNSIKNEKGDGYGLMKFVTSLRRSHVGLVPLSKKMAHAKGTVVGKPASDIVLTEEGTGSIVSLTDDLLDGKSTLVLEWWGHH